MVVSREAEENLKSLGERLRQERLRRNEPQRIFAARIGTSIPTLRKMEDGDPAVQLGFWASALDILDRVRELDQLIALPEDDLFLKYELQQAQKCTRKRASRRLRRKDWP